MILKTMLIIMSARTGDEDLPDDIQPESQSPITLAGQVREEGGDICKFYTFLCRY